MKKISVFLFLFCLFSTFEVKYAQERSLDHLKVSLQDSIQKKEIHFINNDNEEVTISVEKEPQISRLAKGTYKISKSVKGSWEASYNVSVNTKNQFISANNMNVRAFKGSILSTSLNWTTNKTICSFKQKAGTVTSSASVVATISSGGQLVVK